MVLVSRTEVMNKPRSRKNVVVIASLPPPTGGASKNSRIIIEELRKKNVTLRVVRVNAQEITAHASGLLYHAKRMLIFTSNIPLLFVNLKSQSNVYLVLDGGKGIWYNLIYMVIIVLKSPDNIFIHHRGLLHLETYNLAMSLMLKIGSLKIANIFLEKHMKTQFENMYAKKIPHYIVRNAATCDVQPNLRGSFPFSRTVHVGYLSNLNSDKGFDVICKVFPRLARIHPDIEFLIGGVPTNQLSKNMLLELSEQLGERLYYAGEIHGDDKIQFFRNTDIFVFPTKFPQEAQPNVLYEAMASGCIIVATNHACIPFMLDDAPHRLVGLKELNVENKFVDAIEMEIAEIGDQKVRALKRENAIKAFIEIKEKSVYHFSQLLTAITEG